MTDNPSAAAYRAVVERWRRGEASMAEVVAAGAEMLKMPPAPDISEADKEVAIRLARHGPTHKDQRRK